MWQVGLKMTMSMHILTENNVVLYIKEGWPTGGLLSHFVPPIYENEMGKNLFMASM
jgi:hypothetical protein